VRERGRGREGEGVLDVRADNSMVLEVMAACMSHLAFIRSNKIFAA
jgi:hypothetical protein